MILAPPLWAAGSWATNAWADGTWATSVTVVTQFGDLTTLFSAYMADLRHDNPTRNDTETLIARDLATVRAATPGETDDAATMYAKYLS